MPKSTTPIENRIKDVIDVGDIYWMEIQYPEGTVNFHPGTVSDIGHSPEDFKVYEDFKEIIPPEDYQRVVEEIQSHKAGETDRVDVKYSIQTSEGHTRCYHTIGGTTKEDEDGNPLIISGMTADVTEREEMRQELEHKNHQLKLLNDIVRHDIKNDVAIASGYLDLIEEEIPESVEDEFNRVCSSTKHIQMTAENIKEVISVLKEESPNLSAKSVSLKDTLSREIDTLMEIHDPDGSIFTVGDIPDVRVESNGLLASVFKNIIENSLEHNSNNDELELTITTEEKDDSVVVSIADNGSGLPDETKATINGESNENMDDLGLGLFIVTNLVEDFGGDMTVADNSPQGTVCSITLYKADE